MTLLDSESLLRAVSAAEPTGPNLEYDSAFAELDRALAGRAEQQIGEVIVPAEEPDWGTVQRLAIELLGRTKDLRVACPLARALARRNGVVGLNEGLSVVSTLLEHHWQGVHPRLDPDDGNDPTSRTNSVASLSGADALSALRAAPLFQSRAFGPVTARDCLAALGQSTGGAAHVDAAALDAAFREVALDELEALVAGCDGATEQLRSIERTFEAHVGPRGPDLSPLAEVVKHIGSFARPRYEARRVERGAAMSDTSVDSNGSAGPLSTAGPAFRGEIRSRDDVVRALEAICDYYQRYEPSSPIPLLVKRCKRLVPMKFLDILRDMAPEGLSQAEAVTGEKQES